MPAAKPHPRAMLNTGGKPVVPADPPAPKAALPAPGPSKPADEKPADKPSRKPRTKGKHLVPVTAKLDESDVAKLDAIRREIGGVRPASRSSTLRWLVQQYRQS